MNIIRKITSRLRKPPSTEPASDTLGKGWEEKYIGGSIIKELRKISKWTIKINIVQFRNKKNVTADARCRCERCTRFRGWVSQRRFRVLDDAPEFIRSEFFQPGKVYEGVKVRLSNAAGVPAKCDRKGTAADWQ